MSWWNKNHSRFAAKMCQDERSFWILVMKMYEKLIKMAGFKRDIETINHGLHHRCFSGVSYMYIYILYYIYMSLKPFWTFSEVNGPYTNHFCHFCHVERPFSEGTSGNMGMWIWGGHSPAPEGTFFTILQWWAQKRAETYRFSHSYGHWWPIKIDDFKWFIGWLSIAMWNNHKVHNYIPLICCSHPGKFECWEVPKSVCWLILIPGL